VQECEPFLLHYDAAHANPERGKRLLRFPYRRVRYQLGAGLSTGLPACRMARAHSPSLTVLDAFADRRRTPDSKREAVLQTAVRLFVEQGYNQTALSDVAERLKITKPALYHYFRSKEEIFLECYRRGSALIQEALSAISTHEGTGLEKVGRFIQAYADVITGDFARCFIWMEEREFSPEARQEIRGYKRQIDRRLRQLIQAGVEDGSIEPCDPKLAAFAVAGAINSISLWYEPRGALSAQQIGLYFSHMLTQGLARAKTGAEK
jgi:AcrR family transcriptional regulator